MTKNVVNTHILKDILGSDGPLKQSLTVGWFLLGLLIGSSLGDLPTFTHPAISSFLLFLIHPWHYANPLFQSAVPTP